MPSHTQSEQQRKTALDASNLSQEEQTSVIAGTPATSVAPIPVQDPQEPVEPLDIKLQPEVNPSIQSIFEETVFAPSDLEQQGEDIFTKQLESIAKGSQLITEEAELQEQLESAEFTKKLTEVTGQIEGLRLESLDLANKRKIIPSEIDAQFGVGATKAGIAPLVAGALRENTFRQVSVASQALVLQASAFVLQGQYDRAESKINRAIDLKYSLLENEQKFYTVLLDRNKELLSREDKLRAEDRLLRLKERDEQIADQKLQDKNIFTIGRDLHKAMQDSGVSDPDLISRVMNASSEAEALEIAGEFVPKLSEKERLQNELLNAQIKKTLDGISDGTDEPLDLSTASGQLASISQNLLSKFSSKFQQDAFKANVNRLSQAGDAQQLADYIFSEAIAQIPDSEARKKAFSGYKISKKLDVLEAQLALYAAKGGETSLFRGKSEDIRAKFGRVKDVELRILGIAMMDTLDALARDRTGAVISESEEKFYDRLLPSTRKTAELNQAVIDGLKLSLVTDLDSVLKFQLSGSGFDTIEPFLGGNTVEMPDVEFEEEVEDLQFADTEDSGFGFSNFFSNLGKSYTNFFTQ